MAKQKKQIDIFLSVCIALTLIIYVYGNIILEYVCAHNILKGDW